MFFLFFSCCFGYDQFGGLTYTRQSDASSKNQLILPPDRRLSWPSHAAGISCFSPFDELIANLQQESAVLIPMISWALICNKNQLLWSPYSVYNNQQTIPTDTSISWLTPWPTLLQRESADYLPVWCKDQLTEILLQEISWLARLRWRGRADWWIGCSLHGLLPSQGGDMVQSIGGESCLHGGLLLF